MADQGTHEEGVGIGVEEVEADHQVKVIKHRRILAKMCPAMVIQIPLVVSCSTFLNNVPTNPAKKDETPRMYKKG